MLCFHSRQNYSFIHTLQGFKAWVSPEQLQQVSFCHVLFSSEKKTEHYMNIFDIRAVTESRLQHKADQKRIWLAHVWSWSGVMRYDDE